MMNKKVYVTKSKIENLLHKVDLFRSNIDTNNLYKSDLNKILSIPEMRLLALYRDIVNNPEGLTLNKYIKKTHVDSKRFVLEKIYPSYHKNEKCDRLTSSFENFEIPIEIKVKGDKTIEEYRSFFKDNLELYNNNYELFKLNADLKFGIHISPIEVNYENSGVEVVFNASGSEIEQCIFKLLEKMETFRNSTEEIKKEITDCGYATHKAFIVTDNCEKLKKIDIDGSTIAHWHQYKRELKLLLREYFRIKLNPEFLFDVNILDQLGFKACSCCSAH